ncbi:MAG: hypothetical protein IJJ94_06625 [Bacteroidaceae bacterium]|nr:hypothetical protein [Bacteroidaceae bacterium]
MSSSKVLRSWLIVASLAIAMAASAGNKGPQMQRVYMFGFGASLTDSIACQTQVQAIDSAWLDSHKLLVDRSLYSIQLQFHLEQNEGVKNPICTIYFDRNERKLRKLWAKLKRRYESEQQLKLREVGLDRFSFKAEQYNPIIIGDPTEAAAASADKTDKKTKQSGKDKKK